jgi:hypothetical protein
MTTGNRRKCVPASRDGSTIRSQRKIECDVQSFVNMKDPEIKISQLVGHLQRLGVLLHETPNEVQIHMIELTG